MPTAICKDCGAEERWHNYRGVKLADLRCSACGGKLKSKEAQYIKIRKNCPDKVLADRNLHWLDQCKLVVQPDHPPSLCVCRLEICPKMTCELRGGKT